MCCFTQSIHTLRLSVGGLTDGRTHGRTDGRTENIYSIFRDKLLLHGEHVYICYNILLYHIYFVKQIHCINIIESFSLKSNVIQKHKQCTICEQWCHRNNGGFMKHIWNCQQQVSVQSSTDKKNALDHQILCSL
jgi:hypothetical protein